MGDLRYIERRKEKVEIAVELLINRVANHRNIAYLDQPSHALPILIASEYLVKSRNVSAGVLSET